MKETGPLLESLLKNLQGYKRTTVKNLLKFRMVSVNGKFITQFDHPLKAGDQVSIEHDKEKAAKEALKGELQIIYEDPDIVVINKPAGLLTIATDKVRTRTAFYKLNDYVKNNVPSAKAGIRKSLYIVHRLDQDASGLLVFARNLESKIFLQENWGNFSKKYYAVVHGIPGEKECTIENYLAENQFLRMYSSPKAGRDSKYAITKYRVLKEDEKKALLEVALVTGRKHQIRVHLAGIGHPIVGDDKYGGKFRENSKVRLGLHAFWLEIEHPRTHQKMKFETPLPAEFNPLLKG